MAAVLAVGVAVAVVVESVVSTPTCVDIKFPASVRLGNRLRHRNRYYSGKLTTTNKNLSKMQQKNFYR